MVKRKDPFDMDFDIEPIDLSFQKRKDPNKMSKVELIRELANNISEKDLYKSLIRLGKQNMAEEFQSEIELIERKYEKQFSNIDGKETDIGDKILDSITDEIIKNMKEIYRLSFHPKDEIDFHHQLEPFLKGMMSNMENSLSKFGWKTKVEREHVLPSNERIDLLISIGNLKIGIEVKYDLDETSQLQRLLGQIDRYLPYLDIIMIVSYRPLNQKTLLSIKNKEIEKNKKIRILTPHKII
ncbi:MAG: hypothetical protein QXM68_03000 [Candidatus Aenigmatarchaeota archaeon]|nr:PD-(D/E)XK nuclease family protein [Candidatus Aenigmarchaeota archaeon]